MNCIDFKNEVLESIVGKKPISEAAIEHFNSCETCNNYKIKGDCLKYLQLYQDVLINIPITDMFRKEMDNHFKNCTSCKEYKEALDEIAKESLPELNINCDKCKVLISKSDNKLTDDEILQLNGHLLNCKNCNDIFNDKLINSFKSDMENIQQEVKINYQGFIFFILISGLRYRRMHDKAMGSSQEETSENEQNLIEITDNDNKSLLTLRISGDNLKNMEFKVINAENEIQINSKKVKEGESCLLKNKKLEISL